MRQADLTKLDSLMTKLKQFNDVNAATGTIMQVNMKFASDGATAVAVWDTNTAVFEVASVTGGEPAP